MLMKSAGELQEIAHTAVFLASEDGQYMDGKTRFVKGGQTQTMG